MPKAREPVRLAVRKENSSYIDGRFVQAESLRAERGDLLKAVAAAARAFGGWAALAPQGRGRALYRFAGMLEDRRAEFAEGLRTRTKRDETDIAAEIDRAVERALWYAGWCDKFAALLSARNPIDGPFYCYSTIEPIGVAGFIAPDEPPLLGLVSTVTPALVAGNTAVVIASEADPRTALTLCECIDAAGMPPGVFNLLTGRRIDLAPHLARHRDVAALEIFGLDQPFAVELTRLGTDNLKRVRVEPALPPSDWLALEAQDLSRIAALTGLKTIWHPARI